jgi:hypothetical protein
MAVEAEKLGHGGLQYIADLFGCDPHTIRQGAADIELLPQDEVERDKAGSPVDANIRWTNRSPAALAEELQEQGFGIGAIVKSRGWAC